MNTARIGRKTTVGISYLRLHEKGFETAKELDTVEVKRSNKKNSLLNANESIQKEIDRGRIGFKRKHVGVNMNIT